MTSTSEADCVHRWLVEAPTGRPNLAAQCRLCGAFRLFPAVPDEDMTKARGGGRARPAGQKVAIEPRK